MLCAEGNTIGKRDDRVSRYLFLFDIFVSSQLDKTDHPCI